MSSSGIINRNMIIAGSLAAAAAMSLLLIYMSSSSSKEGGKEPQKEKTMKTLSSSSSLSSKTDSASRDLSLSSEIKNKALETPQEYYSQATATETPFSQEEEHTPIVDNKKVPKDDTNDDLLKQKERNLHARIEELDKKGKALFKNKQFVAAAETFTEALDLIGEYDDSVAATSLSRQLITLQNNRSAMYEKANMPELALDDCTSILELEPNHGKARTRKLRILESLERWYDCLVEICAIQLLFMQTHRENLRRGLPTPPPPVPQSKMEQVLSKAVPEQIEKYSPMVLAKEADRPLPSSYTILQLLKSYTGYNKWMAAAAKDGAVSTMAEPTEATDNVSASDRALALFRRGRRHVYDGNYKEATSDFEEAYQLLLKYQGAGELMPGDTHARLLEWTGMARHWLYRLDPASECYEKASELEPNNALILVKQAGVAMDGSLQDLALRLFDMALELDPSCADALLHRSNLYMIQAKPDKAKADLERCVHSNPNHVMARLRLASILAATQDPDGAKTQLDAAERVEPNSSEVQSYRGELYFTQGEMVRAREQFERAMELEPSNPTPYVNCAMAILNTPPPDGDRLDASTAIALLEKALQVDPQFMAAYVQLGQLKLGTATELTKAREVIELYDQALSHCRTIDDLKELCNMRILAVAQVEAASMLKMESFNMQ